MFQLYSYGNNIMIPSSGASTLERKLSEYDETAINCLCPPTFHFCLKILYFIVSERDALFCVIPTLFRLLFTEMPAFNMLKIGANKGLNSVPETDRVH